MKLWIFIIATLLYISLISTSNCAGQTTTGSKANDHRAVVGLKLKEDAPTNVRLYFDAAMANRDRLRKYYDTELKESQSLLSKVQKATGDNSNVSQSVKVKIASLRKLKEESAKKDYLPPPTPSTTWSSDSATPTSDLKVGWVGAPGKAKVIQILDANKVLVELVFQSPWEGEDEKPYAKCVFSGVDTKGLVDGSVTSFDKPAIASTYSYVDVQGSKRTVLNFSELDIAPFIVPLRAGEK